MANLELEDLLNEYKAIEENLPEVGSENDDRGSFNLSGDEAEMSLKEGIQSRLFSKVLENHNNNFQDRLNQRDKSNSICDKGKRGFMSTYNKAGPKMDFDRKSAHASKSPISLSSRRVAGPKFGGVTRDTGMSISIKPG